MCVGAEDSKRMKRKNKKISPLVSIIMPVYNPGSYLFEAIESILNQTYQNFEFIIIDDASTDSSWKIIKSYSKKDKRIKSFKNQINLGVSLTSNIAISKAKGQFLARMDSDDISAPDRLQKQVNYLLAHSKTILLGGQCTIINHNNNLIGLKQFPTDPKTISDMLFWALPVQQGCMMLNRSLLPSNFVWYQPNQTSAEEVNLYFKLLHFGNFANLIDNIYFYRQVEKSLSHLNPKKTFFLTLQSRLQALKNGYQPSLTSLLLNLAQIIAICLLPSNLIYQIWYLLRGVTRYNLSNVPALQTQNSLG